MAGCWISANGVVDVDSLQPDVESLTRTPRASSNSVNSPSVPVPPYNRQPISVPVGPHMSSKRPESLAVKGHEYEELPGHRYLATGMRYPNPHAAQPTPPRSVQFGSKENLCHTGSNGSMMSDKPSLPVYRKRQNPLYEEEKDAMVPKNSKSQSGLCQCPCSAILIFSILSCLTFVLVVLLTVGVISTSNSNSERPQTGASISGGNFSIEYLQLEEKLISLVQKLNKLEAADSSNDAAMNSRVEQLENRVVQIDTDIASVRKMEGPRGYNGSQGPPGAGDLSQCSYIYRVVSGASALEIKTPWFPSNAADRNDRVITGMYCSLETDEGGGVFLDTKNDLGITQFRCVCPGQSQISSTTHTCRLHIWDCPKES